MMGSVSRIAFAAAILILAGTTGYVAGKSVGYVEGLDDAYSSDATKNVTVTCYSWVRNGSAQVSCPRVVIVDDVRVEIDVRRCPEEYVYKTDETPPCEVEP